MLLLLWVLSFIEQEQQLQQQLCYIGTSRAVIWRPERARLCSLSARTGSSIEIRRCVDWILQSLCEHQFLLLRSFVVVADSRNRKVKI